MLASWAGVSILNGIFRPSGFWVTVIKCIVDGLLFLFSYTAQQKWVFKKC